MSIIPVRNLNANNHTLIEKIIKDKLEAKGVEVLEIFIKRSVNGMFNRCAQRKTLDILPPSHIQV